MENLGVHGIESVVEPTEADLVGFDGSKYRVIRREGPWVCLRTIGPRGPDEHTFWATVSMGAVVRVPHLVAVAVGRPGDPTQLAAVGATMESTLGDWPYYVPWRFAQIGERPLEAARYLVKRCMGDSVLLHPDPIAVGVAAGYGERVPLSVYGGVAVDSKFAQFDQHRAVQSMWIEARRFYDGPQGPVVRLMVDALAKWRAQGDETGGGRGQ